MESSIKKATLNLGLEGLLHMFKGKKEGFRVEKIIRKKDKGVRVQV